VVAEVGLAVLCQFPDRKSRRFRSAAASLAKHLQDVHRRPWEERQMGQPNDRRTPDAAGSARAVAVLGRARAVLNQARLNLAVASELVRLWREKSSRIPGDFTPSSYRTASPPNVTPHPHVVPPPR